MIRPLPGEVQAALSRPGAPRRPAAPGAPAHPDIARRYGPREAGVHAGPVRRDGARADVTLRSRPLGGAVPEDGHVGTVQRGRPPPCLLRARLGACPHFCPAPTSRACCLLPSYDVLPTHSAPSPQTCSPRAPRASDGLRHPRRRCRAMVVSLCRKGNTRWRWGASHAAVPRRATRSILRCS